MSKTHRGYRSFEVKGQFSMCDKKRKFKSAEASKWASKFGQRKYECPYCGHWHLTSQKGS